MPIYNWLGGAEVSHTTSDIYQKKVTEFLELDGYILIQTSSDVAMTPDLIFRKPETEGKTDIYVETKYDDVSLSDKEFLSEFARYFILYTSNMVDPFDLYLYFRRCKNLSKWKQIFSATSYNEKTCLAFFGALSENEDLNEENRQKIKEKNFEDFKKFVSDTYVHQMDYERLLMKIEERKKRKKDRCYGYNYYLRELPPIKQKQKIIGNFVEVKKYSGSIYSWQIPDEVDNKIVYNRVNRYEPFYFRGNMLYSLEHIDERLKNCVNEKTFKASNPEDWLLEDPRRLFILQILYKKYILNFGVQKGCNYVHYKGDILYFSHKDNSKVLQKVEGKQVSRLFKDTKSPFVKHEAIDIEVKVYGQRLFVFFSPVVIFTDQNKELITGIGVKKLHDKFSPNRYDNNLSIFGDMKWWFDFLCGKGKTPLETSDLLCLMGNLKPPPDSKTRDGLAATERMEKYL
jgi:hypothetical protein